LRDRVRNVDVADRMNKLLERLVDRLRNIHVDLSRHRDWNRYMARHLHFLDLLDRDIDVARDRHVARDLHRN
jgi:hypothetical protein